MEKKITHRIFGKTFFAALAFLAMTIGALNAQITITTTSLPNGTVGVAYNETLTATGGTRFNWTISAGALPGGLTINSTSGVISGTPTAAGIFNFTVKVTETSLGVSATQPLSITVGMPVCQIGSTPYATLDDALAAITTNAHTTIKLLDNITTEGEIGFINKNITFDLNDKNLIFEYIGLQQSSVVDYTGAGNFKCFLNIQIAGNNSGFDVIDVIGGSTLKLMSVEANYSGGTNNSIRGIYCAGASTVIVNGDVKVTYSGNIAQGIDIYDNSTVTVNGSVTAAERGIYANSNGASTATTVTVNGNVNAANGTGVAATGSTAVTIDGKINATDYIYLNGNAYTVANGVTDPTKPNYLKYSDGISTVWVGNKTTAVESITADELRIYPNPVKDELKIESGGLRIEKVEICDLSGKTVCQFYNLKNKIDVSALSQGIYIVKLKTDKETLTEKFVKD